MPKLVIFRGDAVEHEIQLKGETLRIGRDSRNDIPLDDSLKGVSRFHAEVRANAGAYYIVDMKSRNGVWLNGRRIHEQAELALGVPVTLGAYELVLEDDVPSGEFGDAPFSTQHAVVGATSVGTSRATAATGARSTRLPAAAAAPPRRTGLWTGISVALLVLAVLTFAVVRYTTSPTTTVSRAEPPSPPPAPLPLPPPPELQDPRAKAIAEHLAAAREQMENHEFSAALHEHLSPVLELDGENQEALDLKQQAEAGAAAATAGRRPPAVVATAEPPAPEVDIPNVTRRAGESYTDYQARGRRIQAALTQSRLSLDRQDFAAAIGQYQLVEREQPRYPGLDGLIADARAKQRKALDDAIDSGQRNEQANRPGDALKWYQRGLEIDPTSSVARDKSATLTERLTASGLEAFKTAEVWRKRGDNAKAALLYRQAAELLPAAHEKNREALNWLEKLK